MASAEVNLEVRSEKATFVNNRLRSGIITGHSLGIYRVKIRWQEVLPDFGGCVSDCTFRILCHG
jgi:hypothetical protein